MDLDHEEEMILVFEAGVVLNKLIWVLQQLMLLPVGEAKTKILSNSKFVAESIAANHGNRDCAVNAARNLGIDTFGGGQ